MSDAKMSKTISVPHKQNKIFFLDDDMDEDVFGDSVSSVCFR